MDQQRSSNQTAPPPPHMMNTPSISDLEQLKERLKITLIIINGVIVATSGVASYFLASRTLKPIKQMVDEQQEFISSASHELRTPIAVLRAEMETSLMEKHITDAQARALIKSNLEEVSSMQYLVNNLLKITKLHNGNHELQLTKKELVLSEILETTFTRLQTLADPKKISISTSVPDIKIIADEESIRELFTIIIDNAIKYSRPSSTIQIKAHQEQHMAHITITDTGIGIPPQDIPHIFERFYRSDKSRSQTEGFGLGLPIAQKIVEQHHGKIFITSKVGKGTTVHIDLPIFHSHS